MQKHDLQQIIGRNLYQKRMEKQMTREQLAEKVGVSTTFYANLECGNKMMSIITLRKMADALGVSVDSLLYEERPCEAIDRIQKVLRNQPEQAIAFYEKLIEFCIGSMPQNKEENKVDGCKV